MSKICFIDDRFEKPCPPFIQEACEELGHEVATVFRSSHSPSDLERALLDSQADVWIAIQSIGFLAAEIFASPRFSKVKKAILFYDDPVSTHLLFGRKNSLAGPVLPQNVSFFIWDGYWRRRVKENFGWQSKPTHLAAETKRFFPGQKSVVTGIEHCAVFLGNIPSGSELQKLRSELPSLYQKIADGTLEKITRGPYGLNPFEALDESAEELAMPERTQFQEQVERYLNSTPDFSRPLSPHIQLRRLAWKFGKRETRLRALRAASRIIPLVIMSNLKIDGVAGKDELVQELRGSGEHDLLFVDTSGADYYQLGHLYCSGRFHFQSTDPQSVEGGIPYRVFQSAACAVPLVSDFKKELAECFEPGKEILLYTNETDLAETLRQASHSELREIGRAAYDRFLKEHTWTHRMKALLEQIHSAPQK